MATSMQASSTLKPKVVLQHIKAPKPDMAAGKQAGTSATTPVGPRASLEMEMNEKQVAEGVSEEKQTRTIPEIRERASGIEKKVLTFCLDPAKKINKEQAATIMKHFKDMRSLMEDLLLLQNSHLAGRLEQKTGEALKQGRAILETVIKTLQTSERLETAEKRTTNAGPRPVTYAEKVKITSNKVAQIAVRPPRNVVIIRPDEETSEIKTSEEAREAVFTLVHPRKKGIQVRSVQKVSGNGLMVETTTKEGLKAFTENEKLKEVGLAAHAPTRWNPRMIIYDMPKNMTEKDIVACIRKQNQNRINEEDIAGIKFCFRTGRKNGEEVNWVIEVPPQVRVKLLVGKLFIAWGACRVRDYIDARRCYKCQGYGHVAKHCRMGFEICAHCAESGHNIKECPNREKPSVCVNCKKAGKNGDHAASSVNCQAYKKALETIVAKTRYE
jgi:hypothetical protein